MIVGFEVVACSIKREPGEPINKNLMCPQSPDDANAPEPQEVKKGEPPGDAGRGGAEPAAWRGCAGRFAARVGKRSARAGAAGVDAGAGGCSRGWRTTVRTRVADQPCSATLHTRAAPCLPSPSPTPTCTRPGAEIVYTYDVYWDTSDITWSSRWDAYLRMPGGKVRAPYLCCRRSPSPLSRPLLPARKAGLRGLAPARLLPARAPPQALPHRRLPPLPSPPLPASPPSRRSTGSPSSTPSWWWWSCRASWP